MYDLKIKKEFIIIKGNNIIDEREAQNLCNKVVEILTEQSRIDGLLLNLKQVNLAESNFDIFIQSLTKLDLKRIALILNDPVSSFKFRLWRRRYKKYALLKQFTTLESAKEWISTLE
ncbi:hypothetical protein Halha_0359 [Halobacteroides halobius DSM 5150]|uniref:STAS/SEC14 domain-containing protein n=1 Tax=Halobacteroides halobius (strain ATCC 35273 / DSM 5150 / MD-1) TaxID=748449 RepID=L0K5T6_HALHC|nr:hypothetical protein [Halobacteroides halobius]AGB40361.1 hypothetical protein Halha_0359 [Halobacteroides halobius DSM 5150]